MAIIADIHGNAHALRAVLHDVAEQGVDRVIVNGDMVNRGPANVEVLETLHARGYEATLGNHDDLLRKWVERDPELPATWFDDPFWQGTGWCAEQVDAAGWMSYLGSLPMTVHVDVPAGPSVLVSHGSPRHYREGYGSHLTDEAISEITEDHPADVLVGSHTHRPLERRWGRFLVLNTGAVGTPFNGDPRAQYLVLALEDGRWVPEFRRVPYDRDGALAAFRRSGFLATGGLSAEIFYEELLRARSYLVPFLMWTEESGRDRTRDSWQEFQAAFPERFGDAAPATLRRATGT